MARQGSPAYLRMCRRWDQALAHASTLRTAARKSGRTDLALDADAWCAQVEQALAGLLSNVQCPTGESR